MHRSQLAALLSVFLLVVAGCSAPVSTPGASPTDAPPTETTDTSSTSSWPDDPPTDRLGWEAGYWHNESIDVNQSDGLNATEREAFVARTMARVEVVRDLEFTDPVPVEVISRAEYRNQSDDASDPVHADWNDQVWEALLLVGEDRTIEQVFDEIYGGAVLGYYSPSEDRIVIVSDSDTPAIDRRTLAHELHHALQDQHFGINGSPATQDAQLAENGLVEGDARYVDRLYEDRCDAGEWECVPRPERSSGGGSLDFPVFLTIYTPYSEGPTFVTELHERGGWEAVNDAYENRPVSTEQVLHPERYPDERPVEVTIEDRSSADWTRYETDPVGDTVGEASIFAMFWKHGAIDKTDLQRNPGPYSAYNYTSAPSAGWGGDLVVPYRPASDEVAEANPNDRGYVWKTVWDTEKDAEQFERAYLTTTLKLRLGATRVAPNTYVVEKGPFADAYRVTRRGNTVTIVNAPTVEELDEIHG
ncbi:Hvo_1808 family surface protein [Haloferax larsenii]|uniref:Hvo_1808 family surface protein n=1 Tax=Haloferax larsenii TaxID=302484 RepID=A0ABY5RF75_HALLR|nr:Hvo_1808 family surface protein [Haloferax larsenii]UVE50976.1 Hvo_1808 family surface protein [Haloferax larsenii]